ncbi:MAG: ribonuclease M5 [Firmicutes bacterium]|nr:ribonuclease M5 [Bacillota bacterium]
MDRIKESIIVEGKDDESAVRKALECNVICTHGYGISESTISLIKAAYESCGIIIFTDPDHAGQSIRNKLVSLFPNAKHAYLTKNQAYKEGDVGIENAAPEDIRRAIEAVAQADAKKSSFTESDMTRLGLSGRSDSAKKRAELGAKLGIGYANSKTFLRRLQYMGISPEDIK